MNCVDVFVMFSVQLPDQFFFFCDMRPGEDVLQPVVVAPRTVVNRAETRYQFTADPELTPDLFHQKFRIDEVLERGF